MHLVTRHTNHRYAANVGIHPSQRRLLNSLRDESGQAIVEFALVLFPLLLVIVGIVTFGRAMNYDEQATHLTNEAARYAAVDQVPAGASGTLGQWVRSQADSSELQNGTGAVQGLPTVCVSFPNGTSNIGDPVQVAMSFAFRWVSFLKISPATTTIRRTTTMRIEVPPSGSFFSAGCS